MKILVIDNNTKHLKELVGALTDHKLEVQKYKPGLNFHTAGKDLVILSGGGGEGREANDQTPSGCLWYQDETDFILNCKVPLVGICMGFELIAQAYGAKVEKLPRLIHGWRRIQYFKHSNKNDLKQFESHRFSIKEAPAKHFITLAKSASGVELIKHKKRPIIASQFHPEVAGGTFSIKTLLQSATSWNNL